MRIQRFGSILCFTGVLSTLMVGCMLPLRPSGCPVNPAQQLLTEINQVRTREGVAPVWPNVLLARAAQAHARAISEGRATGHFGHEGSDPLQRITETGYLPRAFGENVAMGSSNPRLVVEAWMRSPGHQQILLDPSVEEVGLGGVLDSDQPIWVADFGSGNESVDTRCHPWTAPSTTNSR